MGKEKRRLGTLLVSLATALPGLAQPDDSIAADTAQWYNQTQQLGEVVVKSRLPKTRVKGDAMRTIVTGTILEKAGTAADLLSRIPLVEAERDGAVKVIGRGAAEVYINGRRVQDMAELSRLHADQIHHVEVVLNPGARYAASTKAVVRITLKKAQGEGISFRDYASGIYQYGTTVTNDFSVNYRTGGLDMTGSLWAGRYGHAKSLQENNLTYDAGQDRIEARSKKESRSIWKGWSPQLQVNYMLKDSHSFGAFYKYDRHPGSDHHGRIKTDNYANGIYTERSESEIWYDDQFSKHIFNAYDNGKVGQLGIDLNIDGLFDDTQTPSRTAEQTCTDPSDTWSTQQADRSIESQTNSANRFWATKLILSYPVWKGNLTLGSEYSHNHRTDAYSFATSEAVPVKATDTTINESATAAFTEYSRQFGKLFAQVGLRYEYLTNDYYNFGQRQDASCRSDGDWFPTAALSLPVGKVQLSLSYRRDIQRPNYGDLTSSTVYINRYTYQSGNPYLKPTYTHNLVFNGAYQWMNLTVMYAHIKDATTMETAPFPGADDPLVSLLRPVNSTGGYDQLTTVASLRPTIGHWHPTWSIVGMFQNYKSLCADGSVITLNKPFVNLLWQNDIELPKGFRLNATMQWASKGDYTNFRVTETRFLTIVGLQRDFSFRQLGSLTFDLRCNDLFNTSKTEATIYGIRELTSANPARRTFMLDLTWKFNEARIKYRGAGAGEKQKARM